MSTRHCLVFSLLVVACDSPLASITTSDGGSTDAPPAVDQAPDFVDSMSATITDLNLTVDLMPPPMCLDKTRDGDETDIDCGGSVCPACPEGKGCSTARDCSGGLCSSGTCLAIFAAPVSYPTGPAPSAIAIADLDGDGKLDLVVTLLAGNIAVLLGKGDGTFASARTLSAGGSMQPVAIIAADLNGDGKVDLAVTNTGGSGFAPGVSVLLNQGAATFAAPHAFPVGDNGLAAGDFTGDGKVDLVVIGYSKPSSNVYLLVGDGSGGFAAQAPVTTGEAAEQLAVGDLNGDGKPDVVAGSTTSINVFLGGGSTLKPAGSVAVTAFNPPQPIALGDFDGDGKVDVVAGNIAFGGVVLYSGNGDGTLAPAASPVFTAKGAVQSVVAADWNHDGKIDLAAADTSTSVWALIGDGTGRVAPGIYDAGARSGALATTDLNHDGKPDLVVVNLSAGQVSVLLNRLP